MSDKVQQSVYSDCVTYAKSRIYFNNFNTFNNVYTDIHTTEWIYNKSYSHDNYAYYHNRIDGRWLCEYKVRFGFEYYICSEYQTQKSLLGEYIGCMTVSDESVSHILVVNHDTETEKSFSFSDETYL